MSYFDQLATVGDIINYKSQENPDHDGVLKAPLESSFEALAGYLTDHHIGVALIYDKAEQIVGIISERDLVRQVALHGPKAFNLPITSMITSEILRCKRTDSLKSTASLMATKGVRHILVLDGYGNHIGIISSSDIELFAGEG